ncbi:cytochrome c [Pseudomonas sp. ZM23]|uniref:Cytochrome c n=1 Tax=Pseudomonas triclosanedens TaxID=2961893 RepID=A0ABY7A6Z7_9PSED|nr:cytochrome c [Pseudomonas triclosanedens]MCP8465718.1 cytochrome c [Pseudomonas triclosanedens]MCP8471213.1 cytochrome c [Pseudomonas triclosanedens]MCP8477017.1 cytochrome c [Pseudomonas triclosanedens]WAI51873.1 cytochrome c [Pseudomonas triclosanedens]
MRASLLMLLLLCPAAFAATLTLELPAGTRSLTSEELLANPQVRDIEIPADVSYNRTMRYRALPLAALLDGVKPADHLQAVALDGFAAELPAAPLLATEGSRAWLAIEESGKPWPKLGDGKPSAGPFYLVWSDPKAAGIGPEQWPFQVASIRYLKPLAERFPALLPAGNAPRQVQDGFAQFQKNCLACHRLNGAGDSQFGPDLNIPHNPTEYFTAGYLKQYIRDPQSLRHWPEARMKGFAADVISDGELDQIVAYLKHMAGRKVKAGG